MVAEHFTQGPQFLHTRIQYKVKTEAASSIQLSVILGGFERNSHNGSKNAFLYQQRKCNKTINKWGEELPIEDEVSELAVISPSAKGIVLTEEFIEVTLPFKRLAIAKNKKY